MDQLRGREARCPGPACESEIRGPVDRDASRGRSKAAQEKVFIGGTEGWSTSANMQPTVDPVRKTYVATPEDEFKHGYGEREPAPMGGSQSWVHPR